MQRILHRRLLARNKALKSSRRNVDKQATEAKRNTRQETFLKDRFQRSVVKAERANRREDWMLGPLAPNRAAGKDGGSYGLLNFQFITPPVVPPAEREEYFNFAVNDRVVVVKGREKGKIARIRGIDETRQSVELIGVNEVSKLISDIYASSPGNFVMLSKSGNRLMSRYLPSCRRILLKGSPIVLILYRFEYRTSG